ncbi:MAG: hypothetical protein WCL53_04110 [Chloroflexota bacterium]
MGRLLSHQTVTVLGAIVAIAFAAGALRIDVPSGAGNLLSEGFGVIASTILTVAFIERRRAIREGRERDTRWRSRLKSEVSKNLSLMAHREGDFALAPHELLDRSLFNLRVDQVRPDVRITISREQAQSLMISLPQTVSPDRLSSAVIDEVIAEGHFSLVVDGAIQTSSIHDALLELRNDFERYALAQIRDSRLSGTTGKLS